MPLWLSAIMKWGGLLIVLVNLALYLLVGDRPAPEAGAEGTAAMEGAFIEMMVFGALAFLCGWAMERASRW